MVLLTFGMGLPSSVNSFWKHLHGHTQKCFSVVKLNLDKLTMKTSQHNRLQANVQGFSSTYHVSHPFSNRSVFLAADESPLEEGKDSRKHEETEIPLSGQPG